MSTTPFMQFWDALNKRLFEQRLPEINYGAARELWLLAEGKARVIATQEVGRE